MKGKIVDVLEKGYKLGDKIIRFQSGYRAVMRTGVDAMNWSVHS
jgi:hypothetical protein